LGHVASETTAAVGLVDAVGPAFGSGLARAITVTAATPKAITARIVDSL
jgi:hypothetical protein